MNRNEVYTVKIYFIKPIDLISIIINTLIEMEYETYTLGDYDKDKLLKILSENKRNVIFLCIPHKQEINYWLDYIEKVKKVKDTYVQIGAFVFPKMEISDKQKFLINNVSVISFDDLRKNTSKVLQKILLIFEAKGIRKHIRVAAQGICEAFISVKNIEKPVRGKVLELSSYAFACQIHEDFHDYFTVGSYIPEILLALRGIRIRISAKLLGFSRENKSIFIFKYCRYEIKDNKMDFSETISREAKQKIYSYIKSCLKEEITEKLAKTKFP
jgi:hypothetical protein